MPNKSVEEIQMFLREIAKVHKSLPEIIPDGIYGKETTNAVKAFQSLFGLPTTGEVNLTTWDRIVKEYLIVLEIVGDPLPFSPFPSGTYVVRQGDKGGIVYIIQVMLNAFSEAYTFFKAVMVTGVFDEPTSAEVKKLQESANLAPTGEVDKATWNALVKTYETVTP